MMDKRKGECGGTEAAKRRTAMVAVRSKAPVAPLAISAAEKVGKVYHLLFKTRRRCTARFSDDSRPGDDRNVPHTCPDRDSIYMFSNPMKIIILQNCKKKIF